MALRDTTKGYSWLSIALHWVAAITVIAMYVIAEQAEELPKAESREMMQLHISIGTALFLVLAFRILWRIFNTRPALPAQPMILDQLARWVPVALLAGIAIMLISGPLIVWSNGAAINIFDLVSLPSPITKNHDLHELAEEIHEFGVTLLKIALGLHVLGVIKHLVINRDGTLKKMLVPQNR